MALSDLIDIKVEFGIGAGDTSDDLWDTALWDEGRWSASEIQWTDMTQLVESFTTSSGKSTSSAAVLTRSRTGTAVFTMDNTLGVFVPGKDTPGFLNLRPGRYVRILARDVTGPTPGPWQPIWFGRIDTIDNLHLSGNLIARVRCTDAFAELAVNDRPGIAEDGAGESASQRITRILDHAGWPLGRRDIATGGYPMQATTLAQDALDLCQITTDSAGGDFWQKPDGVLAWRDQGWKSDTVDWVFGGIGGLPVDSVTPEWTVFRVVNESHMARANGNEQVTSDALSRQLYGRRTHTRLDLVNNSDTDVASLGVLIVAALKWDRQIVTEASVLVQDPATIDFVLNVELGSQIQLSVDTMYGWSYTTLTHVIAISDEVTPSGWRMTLGLDPATVINEHGPYSRDEYGSAYHLGGTPDA